jgi:hypothetical protein
MSLSIPKYVAEAGIQDRSLKYEWDDWHLEEIFDSETEVFHARMREVSFRANIAFTNACGEWIIHRYDLLSTDPVPLQNIEAAWAGTIDPAYAVYWEPPDEKWLGPIRGALSLAIIFALEASGDAFQYTDPAVSAYRSSNLAEHIMPAPQTFQEWRERVLKRLRTLYPLNEDDPLGDVVPREALDPDFDFNPEMTQNLVQTYLDHLDPRLNPFLRAPQQMLTSGFVGTPYRFDIEADRVTRHDY